MTPGNIMLYIGFVLVTVFIAFAEGAIRSRSKKHVLKKLYFFSLFNAAFFSALFMYLVYLFILPDFTSEIVWRYTEKGAPLMFKIFGVWAGQEGTFLLWAAFIIVFIFILFLTVDKKLRESTLFLRTAQISAISGLSITAITILSSPFVSIYETNPDIPRIFVPSDGNGLNSLLLNMLMGLHPPIMFFAYSLIVIPFAASLYLLFSNMKLNMEWVSLVRPWIRASWIFLALSIAYGGLWAYEVLGWGGYWAWDPVETSSFLPWLVITAVLHIMSRASANSGRFMTLAPSLVIASFVLVLYSAFITRSGLWGSVHSFESVSLTAPMKLLLAITALSAVSLIAVNGQRIKALMNSPVPAGDIINMDIRIDLNVVFYLVSAVFLMLMFVPLFGLTYPFIYEMFNPVRLAINIEFYNFWSYLILLPLIILTGYGLSYSIPKERRDLALKAAIALSAAFAFINPGNMFSLIDPSSLFYQTSSAFYKILGSISLFSMAPALIYLLFSIGCYLKNTKLHLSGINAGSTGIPVYLRRIAVALVHLGVFLIVLSLISTPLTISFDTKIKTASGSVSEENVFSENPLGDEFYLVLYDYKKDLIVDSGYYTHYADIADILHDPPNHKSNITVYGRIEEFSNVGPYTYIRISDGDYSLWLAALKNDYNAGDYIVASGDILFDFSSPTTGHTYDMILFAENVRFAKSEKKSYRESMLLDVYWNNKKVTEKGLLETTNKYGGENKVLIDSHMLYDVYVMFNGSTPDYVFLSVRINPLVKVLWIGISLLLIPLSALMLHSHIIPFFRDKL